MPERVVLGTMRAFIAALVEFGYLTRVEADGIRALIERLVTTTPRPDGN